MSESIDHAAAVAAASLAVEEAFDGDSGHVTCDEWDEQLEHAVDNWLAARRAAKAAGFVEALVSKEAVEALRDCWGCQGEEHRVGVFVAMQLLARDLGPLIKADQ